MPIRPAGRRLGACPKGKAKRTWPHRPTLATETTLSDTWRDWIIDNALSGVLPQELVQNLVEGGVPRPLAVREVGSIVTSRPYARCLSLQHRAERAEMVLALRGRLEPQEVERRPKPSASEFFLHYWAEGRPVVLTDATRGWSALERWTPEALRDRIGDAEIEVAEGRSADPDYDMHTSALSRKTPLRAFVDRILAAGPTNDFYAVANNKNIDRASLRSLLDDILVDEAWFDPERLDGGASFWLGPAGTVTPLHHDTTNILFHQIVGRKRFTLISPACAGMLTGLRGHYSLLDAEAPDFPHPRVVVDLAAGDALFLPVGWWHQVRALDVSVSFSLLNFRRPNAFPEYTPGFVGWDGS